MAKTNQVNVRITEEEKEQLVEQAVRCGFGDVSTLIRALISHYLRPDETIAPPPIKREVKRHGEESRG